MNILELKGGGDDFLMWVEKKKWYIVCNIACIKSYVDGGVDGILYCAEANVNICIIGIEALYWSITQGTNKFHHLQSIPDICGVKFWVENGAGVKKL